MSTLKVSAIQSPSTTDGGLAISSTGAVSGGLPTAGRQLLYNGAMTVSQRGTSATGLSNTATYNTADRWWFVSASTFGTQTQDVQNDAPTGSGLSKSFRVLTTTAQASPAAGDVLYVAQKLEGQDLQRVAKGSASAQQLTLSFWVKSNVTGTYVAELYDIDNTRQTSIAYTVSASATWEKKSITFAADATGAFDNDNAGSLQLTFWLGAGSSFASGSLQSSWAAAVSANRAPGQTNLAAAVNNYWQITGVQLETGPVATEFEHRSFGDELARCQRYYWRVNASDNYTPYGWGRTTGTTAGQAVVQHPVPMRTAPTSVDSYYLSATQLGASEALLTSVALQSGANGAASSTLAVGGTGLPAAGTIFTLTAKATTAAYLGFSAEL